MNVQLSPAEKKDIHRIQQLAKKIWQAHYLSIIGQDQIDYMLDKIYSTAALEQQMDEGQQFHFISCEGQCCGFLAISQNKEIASEYFIHKFYIDTSEHRKGIGTETFKLLLQTYPEATTYRLQVNRQNYKPINFYFKLGFVIEKVADFDIGNGYFMNDFVMVKKTN